MTKQQTTFTCYYRVTCHQYELEAPGDERLGTGAGFEEDEDDQRYRVTLRGNPYDGEFDHLELVVDKHDLARLPFGATVRVEIALPDTSEDAREIVKWKKRFEDAVDAATSPGGSVDELMRSSPAVVGSAIELARLVCRGPSRERELGVEKP